MDCDGCPKVLHWDIHYRKQRAHRQRFPHSVLSLLENLRSALDWQQPLFGIFSDPADRPNYVSAICPQCTPSNLFSDRTVLDQPGDPSVRAGADLGAVAWLWHGIEGRDGGVDHLFPGDRNIV